MKTFSTALVMGSFGAIAVFISSSLAWPTWVMFIAWVSYYLFGRTLKGSMIALLQMSLGIGLGALIQILGQLLTENDGHVGFPLAVFILIGALPNLSKIKAQQPPSLVFRPDHLFWCSPQPYANGHSNAVHPDHCRLRIRYDQ